MGKTWDAIVFDLDGTLANTLPDLAAAANEALRMHGFEEWPTDHYRRMVGNGIQVLMERATRHAPADIVEKVKADYFALYDRDCLKYAYPYDGVIEALHAAKERGIALLVVTNKPDPQAQKIIRHLFGETLFDAVFGNQEGLPTKPDPALTLKALECVHADPAKSLFVGDSDVDVFTAHNAGMIGAGVAWGFRGEEEVAGAGAEYLLHDGDELKQLIIRGVQ